MSINCGPAGITMDDKMMNLSKGWFVIYEDGRVVTEDEMDWSKVKRAGIKTIGIKWYDKIWTLTDQAPYIQFKRGSVPFSLHNEEVEVQCTERCIGYYEGSSKVVYRVNEFTGQMRMCVE